MRSEFSVVAVRAVTAAAAFTGVALLFLTEHGGPDEFVFFTTQSNLLVGAVMLCNALRRPLPAAELLRGAVTMYIMVTFLVFHLVLANPSSGFGDGSRHVGSFQNLLLHTAVPLLALGDWLVVRDERPRWRWPVLWLTYPLAYLIFALVRGLLVHRYPYPFLDVTSLGYGGVSIVAGVLLVVFWLLGLSIVAAGRARAVTAPQGPPVQG